MLRKKLMRKSLNLANNLYTCKHMDIHKGFVVILIDKVTGNTDFARKRCNAVIIAKELGLNENTLTDNYNKIKTLSRNDIIYENIRDLKTKFAADDIPAENYRWRKMYWIPKIHKSHFKTRFIVTCSVSYIIY